MTKGISTPYRVVHSSWEYSLIVAGEKQIAKVYIDPDVTEETQDVFEPIKDATANFIADACNAHKLLVRALRLADNHFRTLYPKGVEDGDFMCMTVRAALTLVGVSE